MGKTGLIGCGYWGNILSKNLEFDFTFDLYNKEKSNTSSLDDILQKSDNIFVATPFDSHFETVKKALENNCNVFCEKPFVKTVKEVEELFGLANERDLKLHVDWIYAYHPFFLYVKQKFENNSLKFASFERLNNQAVREDTNSIWDLMCHDISILQYFANIEKHEIKLFDHNSSFGSFEWNNGFATAKNVGNLPIKRTIMKFVFDDNSVIEIDDVKKEIFINNKEVKGLTMVSPLENSIKAFFGSESNQESYNITKAVTKILVNYENP